MKLKQLLAKSAFAAGVGLAAFGLSLDPPIEYFGFGVLI